MLAYLLLSCLFGTIHSWCPDKNGVCTCSGECDSTYGGSGTGTITCIIDGTLPSLQPGDSNGQGRCYWRTVKMVINSIPVLDSSIFNPGFAIFPFLDIHQNSTDPIPFDTQPFMSNLNKDHGVDVTVTSLSGPLSFAAFDTDQDIWLSFEGRFTIDKPLPLWKYPSRLQHLSLKSSVYSDLPSNVFENLQCQEYHIDIYNVTVIKSNMFNKIVFLQFCNVEHVKSFAVNNSNMNDLFVNRGNGYDNPPCTKEASVSFIEAHVLHNTKINYMSITVGADSDIHDQWLDTQSIGYELDLKIMIETNNTIRCDTIGHLTKYFNVDYLTITVETSTPGLSISNEVCGNELNITYNGNCPDAECIVKLDQISSFPLVTLLRLSGTYKSNIDINLTTHFPNLSQLKYKDVCDHFLLTLPTPSTIDLEYLDPSETNPLQLVFRAEQFSMLNLTNILQSTQPIKCTCSISWMIQLRDCHSNKSDTSMDKYLSLVGCVNQNSTVMEYLLSDACCNSIELPTPIPNCNGSQTLPPAVLTFDHRDLPQCTTNKQWRFDPCNVQSFYDNPLPTRQPSTTEYVLTSTSSLTTTSTSSLTTTSTSALTTTSASALTTTSTPALTTSSTSALTTTSTSGLPTTATVFNSTSASTTSAFSSLPPHSVSQSTTKPQLPASTSSISEPTATSTIARSETTTYFNTTTDQSSHIKAVDYLPAIIVSLLTIIGIAITCFVCLRHRCCNNNPTVHVEVSAPSDADQTLRQGQQSNDSVVEQADDTNPIYVPPSSGIGYMAGRDFLLNPLEPIGLDDGPDDDYDRVSYRDDFLLSPLEPIGLDDGPDNDYDLVSYRDAPTVHDSEHDDEHSMDEDDVDDDSSSYDRVSAQELEVVVD